MIDRPLVSDRPPVADRPLPDPTALRQATLLAARRVDRRPVRRRRRVALVLVAAALLSAALLGALRTVVPGPQVAGPVPSPTVLPLPSAVEVDRGPASSAQIRSASRRCLRDTGQPPVQQVLYARLLEVDGKALPGLVLRLTDGTVVSCLDLGFTVVGDGAPMSPSAGVPAVRYDGAGSSYVTDEDGTTYQASRIFTTIPEVVAVDLQVEQPDGSSVALRGRVVDGWAVIPVRGRAATGAGGAVELPAMTAVGYDASGNRVPVLIAER